MTPVIHPPLSRRMPTAEPTMTVFLFRPLRTPANALVIDLDRAEWTSADADDWLTAVPSAAVIAQIGGGA